MLIVAKGLGATKGGQREWLAVMPARPVGHASAGASIGESLRVVRMGWGALRRSAELVAAR